MAHGRRPATHEENRNRVCIVCFEKAKYDVTNVIVERIKKYFIENYSLDDSVLPKGICSKCRNDLLEISQGKKDITVLPDTHDFSSLFPFVRLTATRQDPFPVCHCQMCDVARCKGTDVPKRKPGRPSSLEQKPFIPRQSIVKICTSCYSTINRGLSHSCNVSTLRNNVSEIVTTEDQRSKDLIAGKLIHEKFSESYQDDQISFATRGPNPIKISMNKKKSNREPEFHSSALNDLQISLGASNVAMKSIICPFIRKTTGRYSVEGNCQQYFIDRDNQLSDFFTSSEITVDDDSKLPVVFCKDVILFIDHIIQARGLDQTKVSMKIGADTGAGFSKSVCP